MPNRSPESDAPGGVPPLQSERGTLRFLDFLMHEEVKAVVSHGGGLVNVPTPERFAIHTLLVSRLRLQTAVALAQLLDRNFCDRCIAARMA